MPWLSALAVVIATVAVMEIVATLVHRHVMHGPGWGWHKSHHEPREGLFEKNDYYAIVFLVISLILFSAGAAAWPALWWMGLGMAVYGLFYALLHDGLVHRRFSLPKMPRSLYLKRLIQAHRLHHSVRGRDGAVSFGFLYAPPVRKLKQQLRGPQRIER